MAPAVPAKIAATTPIAARTGMKRFKIEPPCVSRRGARSRAPPKSRRKVARSSACEGSPHKSLTFRDPALIASVPYPFPKRLLDRAVSAALAVLLLPLFVLVLVAYLFDVLLSPRD